MMRKLITKKQALNTSNKSLLANRVRSVFFAAVLVSSSLSMTGCGYNKLQMQDESVDSAWSEVINQYQRRADLVPNLVESIQKYADHEEAVFSEVANARAKLGGIQMTADALNDPKALENFQQAQLEMKGALSRLMMVSESYPQLKSDALFLDFQAQLEGTENRIAVARKRYIKSVQSYNSTVRKFPSNITAKMFGMDKRTQFTVENEESISKAPKVDFSE